MRSNLRWCSDVFEITCWNGEIVRIVFVIDAHDREVLAWHAVAGVGVSGSMVRDLMLEAVGLRFATIPGPHAVEWLSDNGSPFTAKRDARLRRRPRLGAMLHPGAQPGVKLQREPPSLWARNDLPQGVHSGSSHLAGCPVKRGNTSPAPGVGARA